MIVLRHKREKIRREYLRMGLLRAKSAKIGKVGYRKIVNKVALDPGVKF